MPAQIETDIIKNEPIKKGILISKPILWTIIIVILISFVAVLIGLSVGLKQQNKPECNNPSETQKYLTCLDFTCKNFTILQGKL